MWKTGIVKELIPSRNGLVRSVTLKTPNGNLINRAIQCLHPLELREDQDEDVDAVDGDPEPEEDPAPADPAPIIPAAIEAVGDPVDGEVEPHRMGSGGEYVGNRIDAQQPTTSIGRKTRLPRHLNDYCFRGPR
jgi:hypothetical protein